MSGKKEMPNASGEGRGAYTLDGHVPVECNDLLTWAKWFESADIHVANEERDGVRVSTVFLGLDHRFGGNGPPILFETMIFGGPHDQDCERYATWEAAEAGHADMCKRAFPSRLHWRTVRHA